MTSLSCRYFLQAEEFILNDLDPVLEKMVAAVIVC